LKRLFAILLFLVALGGLISMLQTELKSPAPDHLMLTSTSGKIVIVAADKTRFKLLAEIGSGYGYIHRVPESKEDQRDLARSQQLAVYLADTRAEMLARKKGLILDLPVSTPCKEIQRLRFAGSRLFPGEFTGLQIRITDGPHKGFEGWVFPSFVRASTMAKTP
jgi:hypothetical protein